MVSLKFWHTLASCSEFIADNRIRRICPDLPRSKINVDGPPEIRTVFGEIEEQAERKDIG